MDNQLLAVTYPNPVHIVTATKNDVLPEVFTFVAFLSAVALVFMLFRAWRS